MIFGRGFSTQGELEISYHQYAVSGQVQQHPAYTVCPHLFGRGQEYLDTKLVQGHG